MKRQYILPVVIIVFIAFAALVAYLHGVNIPILEPAGPIALEERWVIVVSVLLCAIVVVPVFFLLFYFAWKYSANHPDVHIHHRPDWDHDNTVVEFSWWLVPTVIIAILAVIMWQSAHALDPYKPLPGPGEITVDVVALDWKWLFIYPDFDVASVNMLVIPENTPVHFELTADAPMNSFWVPQLGGQIMVMPGMQTQLNLEASRTGAFNGSSANISGEGFSGMAFTVESVSQVAFDNWVSSVLLSQNPLTLPAYDRLAQPSEYNPVAYYSPVDQDLYAGIMMKFMAPGQDMMGAMPMSAPANTDQDISTSSTPAIPDMPGMNMTVK